LDVGEVGWFGGSEWGGVWGGVGGWGVGGGWWVWGLSGAYRGFVGKWGAIRGKVHQMHNFFLKSRGALKRENDMLAESWELRYP